MSSPVENYVPQTAAVRRFDMTVWAAATAIVGLWTALIIVAPALSGNNAGAAASWIYGGFSYLCHQQYERGFQLFGEPFAVCARCFGIYFGVLFGMLGYPLFRRVGDAEPIPRIWLLLAPVPTTVDFLLGYFGIWQNTHFSRFFTGSILGVGCAFFLIPGIVEISRFAFGRRLFKN